MTEHLQIKLQEMCILFFLPRRDTVGFLAFHFAY